MGTVEPLLLNKEMDVIIWRYIIVFGPREEIIVNNNGYGGYGGTTIIEERRGCNYILNCSIWRSRVSDR